MFRIQDLDDLVARAQELLAAPLESPINRELHMAVAAAWAEATWLDAEIEPLAFEEWREDHWSKRDAEASVDHSGSDGPTMSQRFLPGAETAGKGPNRLYWQRGAAVWDTSELDENDLMGALLVLKAIKVELARLLKTINRMVAEDLGIDHS